MKVHHILLKEMDKKSKIRKIQLLHMQFTCIALIIGILCIIISAIPYGYEWGTGILQGIGTGLVTGVVVLLISGFKRIQYDSIVNAHDKLCECNKCLFSTILLCYDLTKNEKTYEDVIKSLEDYYASLADMVWEDFQYDDIITEKKFISCVNSMERYINDREGLEELVEILLRCYDRLFHEEIAKKNAIRELRNSII